MQGLERECSSSTVKLWRVKSVGNENVMEELALKSRKHILSVVTRWNDERIKHMPNAWWYESTKLNSFHPAGLIVSGRRWYEYLLEEEREG